jgi:hypothetical protein
VDPHPAVTSCTLTMTAELFEQLTAHLFPGDHDEHGAVVVAGVAHTPRGLRLLARDLFLAQDGIDFVPGRRGYRMLRGEFILDKILLCRDQTLCYLAVHNHGGVNEVAFSGDDLASHERGYPSLLDVSRGSPVGALVMAKNAVAGDIWLSPTQRVPVRETRIVGSGLRRLYPSPPQLGTADRAYDRQSLLYGRAGQHLLQATTVGVIGAGGAGSLLIEYLARLGVGRIVTTDPDRLELTNVPRVVGSRRVDAVPWMTDDRRPRWMRRVGARLATAKVRIARRVAKQANKRLTFDGIRGDVADDAVARRFLECDYLFLAADSMQARLVFNALVHQYLIPGVQVGAKVRVDRPTGNVLDVYSVVRPVMPGRGCLWCNGLITPARLALEAASLEERDAQQYVEDAAVIAPSVITLNAVAAAHAADDFMVWLTGLAKPDASTDYTRFLPRERAVRFDAPRRDSQCPECGRAPDARFGMGDALPLPTRARRTYVRGQLRSA